MPYKNIIFPCRFSLAIIHAFFLLAFGPVCYAFDTLRLNDKTKLFNITDQTVSIVGAKYVGWSKNWEWAGANIKAGKNAEKAGRDTFNYIGDIGKLGMSFSNTVKTGKNSITWGYNWQKKADHPDAMGFGIEFNLGLNSPTFNNPQPAPELLPGKQGWSWQMADGQKIEVKFSPAVANIYFVSKEKNKIRALIYTAIKSGNQATQMTVSVSGKKVEVGGPISLNYDNTVKREDWPQDILADTASPVDLSGLNDKPAGKHGFVKAKGDELVFANGSPARFWGGNLQAHSVFMTSDADVKAQAKRIAELGFNLMRITHHDTPWVNPNVFQNQKVDTQQLSEKSLKKLDWWIHCLKEEGVYVWLDLHVERNFTPKDGITAFEEIAKGKRGAEAKGYNYYNESIWKSMQRFNEAYLKHVNSFTGLAYKDDPAIMAMLITNENDLTHHFATLMLPENKVPHHTALFKSDIKRFSQQTGLPENSLWQGWGPGNPKLYLNDAEHRFNEIMISHLRGLGVKTLLATTNSWAGMSLYSLPSLTDGDLIDAHSYAGSEEFNSNPRFKGGYLSWIGSAQVTGKPLSVTEWNADFYPMADRFTMPIRIAATAALQGWDAMMVYGYSQNKLSGNNNKVGHYSIYNDPSMVGLMPAAALLFRQNQVSPAKHHYELKFNNANFYNKKSDPTTSKSIRTLLETSRFSVTVPENKNLPWLKDNLSSSGRGTIVLDDPNKDMIPAGQDFIESDTGEMKRDWRKGIQTIDAPEAQVASGWLGGNEIKLSQASFNIKTKKAVAAIQSLDNKPLGQSKRIFITIMARNVPSKDLLHYLSEPVAGMLSIKAAPRMTLYSLDRLGRRDKQIKTAYTKGKYEINLAESNPAHWYLLTND